VTAECDDDGRTGVDRDPVPAEMPMAMPKAIPTTTHQNASRTALDRSQNIPIATLFSVPDRMLKS